MEKSIDVGELYDLAFGKNLYYKSLFEYNKKYVQSDGKDSESYLSQESFYRSFYEKKDGTFLYGPDSRASLLRLSVRALLEYVFNNCTAGMNDFAEKVLNDFLMRHGMSSETVNCMVFPKSEFSTYSRKFRGLNSKFLRNAGGGKEGYVLHVFIVLWLYGLDSSFIQSVIKKLNETQNFESKKIYKLSLISFRESFINRSEWFFLVKNVFTYLLEVVKENTRDFEDEKFLEEYILINPQNYLSTAVLIEHAIERMQLFIFLVRAGRLAGRGVRIDAARRVAADAEWKAIENYDAWRAGRVVELFPENAILPRLWPKIPKEFVDIIDQNLSPAALAAALDKYSLTTCPEVVKNFFIPVQKMLIWKAAGDYDRALESISSLYGTTFTPRVEALLPKGEERADPTTAVSGLVDPYASATIRNYKNFLVILVARCLLAYADLEFGSGIREARARAQRLYIAARLALRDIRPSDDENLAKISNPVVDMLRRHAAVNIEKLDNGRDITGLDASIRLETGKGAKPNPSPYRYPVLIERARSLAQSAAQIEASFLAALEKRDAESYNLMKARLDMNLSGLSIDVQSIRVREAAANLKVISGETARAQRQYNHYQGLLAREVSALEQEALDLMSKAETLEKVAAGMNVLSAVLPASISAGFPAGVSVSSSPQGSVQALAAGASSWAASANTAASAASTRASFARRKEEWTLLAETAKADLAIGEERGKVAINQQQMADAELKVVELRARNDSVMLEFLANKFTNTELYAWMGRVLEGIYRYFLTQAAATAQLAEAQLSFERQEPVSTIIEADYWDIRASAKPDERPNERHGLTGSARLLQDIQRLDDHAFKTARRRLELTKTISLSRYVPFEFNEFRRTGILRFGTFEDLFDRDFPGHYHRLIHKIRVSVIGLIPAVEAVKATLTASGVSAAVREEEGKFAKVSISRLPEEIAITMPRDCTGAFEGQATQADMLRPFEGMGVETLWEFALPKAANQFDYQNIADVLITIEYTALSSPLYRSEIVARLNAKRADFAADRVFSLARDMPDIWYEINNIAHGRAAARKVRLTVSRQHYPANMDELFLNHLVLYAVAADPGKRGPLVDAALKINDRDVWQDVGQTEGFISTRRHKDAKADLPAAAVKDIPAAWEGELDPGDKILAAIRDGQIKDLLLIITYRARLPEWSA